MKNQDIVDISSDGLSRQKYRRRRVLRVAGPIGFVIVMLAALLAITAYSYNSNRRDALVLSDDLLGAIERRIARELEAFLVPAEGTAQLAADVLANTSFDTGNRAMLEPLAFRVLANLSQVSMVNIADSHGNFLMVKKMPDESLHTKLIERTGKRTQVTWIRRDKSGNEIDVETSVDGSFDPRNRPWYIGAVKDRQVYWSDFYILFTDQEYAITVSVPIIGRDDQLLGVIGLDIELEAISAFLHTLKIGKDGRAIIIDEEGYLVAHPEIDKMVKREGEVYRPVRLEELIDPVLHRAFNRFQIEGHGHRDLIVNDRRYLSTAFLLPKVIGHDLTVFIFVPEEDFVGFVTRNNRTVLLMSFGILGLAAMMAGLMGYQGLRADRNARLVLDRQHDLEAQSQAFSELASERGLFDAADGASFGRLTEIVTKAINVRRASVWQLDSDGNLLRCRDCFDGESGGHTQGTILSESDFHQLFDVFRKGEDVIVDDVGKDVRLSELYRVYLHPLGCESLLAVPVRYHDETVGALWFEHDRLLRSWSAEEMSFARAIANMLAMRFSIDLTTGPRTAEQKADKPTAGDPVVNGALAEGDGELQPAPDWAKQDNENLPKAHISAVEKDRFASFSQRLQARYIDSEIVGADIISDTTVCLLRFTDPVSLAKRIADNESITAVDLLVSHLDEFSASLGIEYIRVMGDEIVCAAGIDSGSKDHCYLIADLALSVADFCSGVFAELNAPMEFRIGIDTGAAMGSLVGRTHQSYNLSGEAVRVASMMAKTGVPGGIQVSEQVYRRLQARFLFKPRGRFYLPVAGEASTYLLTGRL